LSTIFNQKEEVISFELTKHGKKLLGLGTLQPSFYSFFDDSIIYDTNYYNLTEDRNSIQERIFDNSLTFKSLNNISHNTKNFDYEDLLGEPIGNSYPFSDFAPSWDLKTFKKKIIFLSNFSTYYKNVFNVETLNYVLKKKNEYSKDYMFEDKEYILIDLQELNVSDINQKYDIEIYMVEGEVKKKLLFDSKKNNIIDDIIYDENELPSNYFENTPNKNDVAYYLDVQADEEIDLPLAAQAIREGRSVIDALQIDRTVSDRGITTTYDGAVGKEC